MELGTKEYRDEVVRRFKEGGTLWIAERTDTHEFYRPSMEPHVHTFGKGWGERNCSWSNEIGLMEAFAGYLTKEDGERARWTLDYEHGCAKCGHGGIPVEFTEHEFTVSHEHRR